MSCRRLLRVAFGLGTILFSAIVLLGGYGRSAATGPETPIASSPSRSACRSIMPYRSPTRPPTTTRPRPRITTSTIRLPSPRAPSRASPTSWNCSPAAVGAMGVHLVRRRPFSTNPGRLGVPVNTDQNLSDGTSTLFHFNAATAPACVGGGGQIANMNVYSNVTGIVTGTGIQTGNAQFWGTNYTAANTFNVPNASGTNYDWGDGPAPITTTASCRSATMVHRRHCSP